MHKSKITIKTKIMKKLFAILTIGVLLLSSCADSKVLKIEGKQQRVEPYGWANYHVKKVPGVVYKVNVGNVVWSVILSETIIVPIWLTGWEIMEPVGTVIEGE